MKTTLTLLILVGASAQLNPSERDALLTIARSRKGTSHWAGGGELSETYALVQNVTDGYTGETFLSTFALFADDDVPASAFRFPGSVMNCWQWVESSLAIGQLLDWTFEGLGVFERAAMARARGLDAWLRSVGVPAANGSAPSFHASVAYLGHVVGMLGAMDAVPWFVNGTFTQATCPPPGAVVSFGYTSHFLVSSGAPPAAAGHTPADLWACRFVHLFRGGCADAVDCWGRDHVADAAACSGAADGGAPLTRACNASGAYETDLVYLANVTRQWGGADDPAVVDAIHFMDPRRMAADAAASLSNTDGARAWALIASAFEGSPVEADTMAMSSRALLQQLAAAGAVDDVALVAAGIDPTRLAEDPTEVSTECTIALLQPLFADAFSQEARWR